MPQLRPFQQVDVFTNQAYYGNPLAVVLDGSGLSDDDMQRFARWTHLSETTFLLPPSPQGRAAGADYRVRIFTSHYEMPFAGHPTLGSCHAWLAHGGIAQKAGVVVQECKVGLVHIQNPGTRRAFAAPPLARSAPTPALLAQLAAALGLESTQVLAAQHQRNGPHHIGLLLDHTDTVLALEPDHQALTSLMHAGGFTGVGVAARYEASEAPALIGRSNREARAFGASAAGNPSRATPLVEPDLEVRFFHLGKGITEDPITGSFNAGLAQWLIADGHMPRRYVAAQGSCIGCAGRVFIEQDASGQVWVGGDTVGCVSGQVLL